MKTKKLTPRNVAPVKRNTVATTVVSTNNRGVSPLYWPYRGIYPFAGGDEAE